MIFWKSLISIIALAFVSVPALPAFAQDKMALTITPPIIKNNVSPGQLWKSYIKVVNNNDADIDAYVQLVNFESDGESGTVKLDMIDGDIDEDNEYLINNWIIIEKGPIKIAANQSSEIPFIVDVPEKADPGDHHIAILIGTKPIENGTEGSSIKIASMLGSLLLLNVNGDVKENGSIREFSTDKGSYSFGDVKFTLRFQNTGNTILQPQGDIKIYDFKGNEKGSVSINQKTNTGNVFPDDIRRWDYIWPVPMSLMEMGRYRAEMSLAFGNEVKETANRTIYFWVIKWKPLLIAFSVIISIFLLIVFMVRRYVKNAIRDTQEMMGVMENGTKENQSHSGVKNNVHPVVDLKAPRRTERQESRKRKPKKSRGISFISVLVVIIALVISLAAFLFLYFTTKESVNIPLEEVKEQNIDFGQGDNFYIISVFLRKLAAKADRFNYMINKTIKKIHHHRIGFLILISVFFIAYLGLNPLDISKYYGVRFGSAIGMSVSIPENPTNKLALDLKEKEDSLKERERDLAKREADLAGNPDSDRLIILAMGGGIIILFVLILVNFYLDRNYRNKKK